MSRVYYTWKEIFSGQVFPAVPDTVKVVYAGSIVSSICC